MLSFLGQRKEETVMDALDERNTWRKAEENKKE